MTTEPNIADLVRQCAVNVLGWKQCDLISYGENGICRIGILGSATPFDPLGAGCDAWRILEAIAKKYPCFDVTDKWVLAGSERLSDGYIEDGQEVWVHDIPDCLKPFGIKGLLVFAGVKLLGGDDANG